MDKMPFALIANSAIKFGEDRVDSVMKELDKLLSRFRPSTILLGSLAGTLLLSMGIRSFLKTWARHSETGRLQPVHELIRCIPSVKKLIAEEKAKIAKEVQSSTRAALPDEIPILSLPCRGSTISDVLSKLSKREKNNLQLPQGHATVSGAVYMQGEEMENMLNRVYAQFSVTNPLHPDIFPSVRLMEAEVIAMTASLLGGGKSGVESVCGTMTSGGSESILMAVKASRDYMKKTKNIHNPHMIIAESAHAAYWKASEYFCIQLSVVPVDSQFLLHPSDVKKHLRSNTILVVASAYGFPHGLVDPIEEIGRITKAARILLHVDACLGGFVLPFASMLGLSIPTFDFSIDGVTSMSVDTHKYGMAHKGTSVVLFRYPELRRCQYTRISDWTGGLYISPGLAGSRSGALIATAWASLVYNGIDGYKAITEKILGAATGFKQGLRKQLPQLEIVGDPQGSVVAFKSTRDSLNIYKVHDLMMKKGWHLSSLQFPPALHMCFTGRNQATVENLLQDLASCVAALEANPDCVTNGMAGVYGATCSISDRRIVCELLETYQDTMLQP